MPADPVTRLYRSIAKGSQKAIPDAAETLRDDPDGLARLLHAHRKAILDLRLAEDAIVNLLLPWVPFEGMTVEGVGTLKPSGGGAKRTRYDNTRVASYLAADLADRVATPNEDTGELPPIGEIVARVVAVMVEATGAGTPSFDSWRSSVLRSHGFRNGLAPFVVDTSDERTAKTIRIT